MALAGLLLPIRENVFFDVRGTYTYAFHEQETTGGTEDLGIDVFSVAFSLVYRFR